MKYDTCTLCGNGRRIGNGKGSISGFVHIDCLEEYKAAKINYVLALDILEKIVKTYEGTSMMGWQTMKDAEALVNSVK